MSMQTQTDAERSEEAQDPTTADSSNPLTADIARSLGRLEGASKNFATKSDVAEAEQRMSEKVADVRIEVASVRTEVADVRIEVASVRTEVAAVRAEVAQVEQRMTEKISAVAAEVADVRTEVAQVESRLIKWIVGTGIVLFIGLGGLLFALLQ